MEINLPDKNDQEFLRVSCTYGRIKYQLFEQVWRKQLLAVQAEITKTPLDRNSMKNAILAYERLWDEWRKLKSNFHSCPTLYRDDEAQYCFLPPFREALNRYKQISKSNTNLI